MLAKTACLSDFIAWLETIPKRGRYDWENCFGECLLGRYMMARGIPWGDAPVMALYGQWEGTSYQKTARAIFGPGKLTVLVDRPHTFGAALKRAKAFANKAH